MTLTVAVVGAGFAGAYAIREIVRLKSFIKDDFKIFLFEPREAFLFTPLLHEVATAGLSIQSILVPNEQIFSSCVTHIKEKAEHVDLRQRQVKSKTHAIAYDYLILAPGSSTTYFGNAALQKSTLTLKTEQDALKIRYSIEQAILDAVQATTPKCKELLTFTVIGGGPTGIELAGEIGQFVSQQAKRHHIKLTPTVRLIQAAPSLLPSASPWMQKQALKKLQELGVEVLLDTKVTDVKKNEVITTEKLPSNVTIWVAGIAPNLVPCNPETKECKKYFTNDDLSLPDHPEVFALGDAAGFDPALGQPPLPALAQAAVQEGKVAARNLILRHNKKSTHPFSYHSKGFLVSIGQKFALAEITTPVGLLRFKGFFAWWLWRTIYLFKYMNAGLKVKTAAYWTVLLWRGRDLRELAHQR